MRNLSEDSPWSRLQNVSHRVRQLERRPCTPCGATLPLDTFRVVSGASINAVVISACPSIFYGHQLGNNNATLFRYVHLFDQATLPTSGQTPKLTFAVPWQSGANQEYDDGIEFPNGLAMAFSTDPNLLVGVAEQEVIANIAWLQSADCAIAVQFTGLETTTNQMFVEGTDAYLSGVPEVPAIAPAPSFIGTEPAASGTASTTTGTTSSRANQLVVENPESSAVGLSETP